MEKKDAIILATISEGNEKPHAGAYQGYKLPLWPGELATADGLIMSVIDEVPFEREEEGSFFLRYYTIQAHSFSGRSTGRDKPKANIWTIVITDNGDGEYLTKVHHGIRTPAFATAIDVNENGDMLELKAKTIVQGIDHQFIVYFVGLKQAD